jgi:hypothetical protein
MTKMEITSEEPLNGSYKPPFFLTVRKIVTEQNPYPPATQSTAGYEEEKTIYDTPLKLMQSTKVSKLCIYCNVTYNVIYVNSGTYNVICKQCNL